MGFFDPPMGEHGNVESVLANVIRTFLMDALRARAGR
jgi:hypothetical protein